jgi:nucleoside-diphosphate-sugar epimerase
VPVRSYRSGANVACFPVNRLLTDLLDPGAVRQAVTGARYVFHLAYGASGGDAARVTVEGTKNVVEAAIAAGAESLVVVSTATVFGHPKTDRPIDETFPYRSALGDYGESKTAAEKYALQRAKTSGATRISVIDPAAIYGPTGYLFTEFPARATAAGEFAWIEEGRGKFNYTFVSNVVDALLLAAANPTAHGERFIISDGVCTMRQFLSGLLGSAADSLASYTRAELLENERRRQATWRDLARGLMNEEVMRAVNGIPWLAAPKRLVERRLAGAYSRMQVARSKTRTAAASAVAAEKKSEPPPVWLADIFGPIEIEYSSAKARQVLQWVPVTPLESGLAVSREWLRSIGIAL